MRSAIILPLEQTPVLRVPSVGCTVELRRSSRAKRFCLKVSHTERAAILTLPNRGRVEDANAFLARHADWLRKQLERLPEPAPFVEGAIIPVRGELHRIKFTGPQRYSRIVWQERDIVESASAAKNSPADWRNLNPARFDAPIPSLHVSGDVEHAPRRLHDWLRAEVRKDISESVEKYAKTLGCSYKRIAIRDQATRWGSCSTSGSLSFSWRLIFAPPFVLDYVAAHEVAHLREMNHGPRFWRLMRDAVPGMQRARIWLKTHGAELHRFGSDL